ncbi:MAG: hypothetical protein H7124_01415 [Phycisphaerales bacterium]|nr:hypothetical protein [Hyphomonadaceae bacterium]
MPGVSKTHKEQRYGRAFPASRYNDPRGGRASGLDRNVLRYRAAEAALYLYYDDDVRRFMRESVYPDIPHKPGTPAPWQSDKSLRLAGLFRGVVADARREKRLTAEDADGLNAILENDARRSAKLKDAFGHAIEIGMFTKEEANELNELLDYRNGIAHRVHELMADVGRSYAASDYVRRSGLRYKGDALDRLRAYRESLWDRAASKVELTLPWNDLVFETAERVYEEELKRLEPLILRQIDRANKADAAVDAECNLRGTEFTGDLDPRFPANHRRSRPSYKDEYVPPTGHLTKRGAEICYRLYDAGKSPLAMARMMGFSLRAANNRKRLWTKAGGRKRTRAPIMRYDLEKRVELSLE